MKTLARHLVLLAVLAPGLGRAQDTELLSLSLLDPMPCPGQLSTLQLQIRNNNASSAIPGHVLVAVETSLTHPSCAALSTATEADKWWLVNASTSLSSAISPSQTYANDGGYNLNLGVAETRTVNLPIQLPAGLALGGSYKIDVNLDDYYATGGTGSFSCLDFNTCVSASSGRVQARVEGAPANGAQQLVWLDYNLVNSSNNAGRLSLPACFTITAYAPAPDGSTPTLAGNTVTWTLPNADASVSYTAAGSLWVLASLAGCSGSQSLQPALQTGGGAFADGTALSEVPGASTLVLTKQQLDAGGNPVSSLVNGQTVTYVLSYSLASSGLQCFSGFDELGAGQSYANPAAPAGWLQHPYLPGTWQTVAARDGGTALQYSNSPAGYAELQADCPALKSNGEDVCGGVLIVADVRIDGNGANGDATLFLRDNSQTTGSSMSYAVLLSIDPNPAGNIQVQRNLGGSFSWPAGGAYTAPAAAMPQRGVWYTVKAMEQPVGSFYLKYWRRGDPEPAGWQVVWTDPSPLPCGSAGDGIVWRPGLGGPSDLASYDNVRFFGAASATGLQVWDTVPAGVDYVSASPAPNGSVPSGGGYNEGALRWDFTGNNYGAVGGVVYGAGGSFTWTGMVDCGESLGPVVNTASIKATGLNAVDSNSTLLAVSCAGTHTPTLTASPTPFAGSPTRTPTISATPTRTPTPSMTPTATPAGGTATASPSPTVWATRTPGPVVVFSKSLADVTGNRISYLLDLDVQGSTGAFDNYVWDTLPAGTTFVSANPAPSSNSGGLLVWQNSYVVSGTHYSITLVVDALASTVVCNTASYSSFYVTPYGLQVAGPVCAVAGSPLTPTASSTATPTAFGFSASATVTPTNTVLEGTMTSTPSMTPTRTACGGCSATVTATLSPTPTYWDSVTATQTQTPGSSATITPSPTRTATPTATPTGCAGCSSTISPTVSNTPTSTPTFTPSRTACAGCTATLTATLSATPTGITPGVTLTFTASPTACAGCSSTVSPTVSYTPTWTPTFTPSRTACAGCTNTMSPTSTPSRTPSATPTWTPTFSATITSGGGCCTLTQTLTPTPSFTASPTACGACTQTLTPTRTVTCACLFSPTATPLLTPGGTQTPTACACTVTVTQTRTTTPFSTPTRTPTPSRTASPTVTPTGYTTPVGPSPTKTLRPIRGGTGNGSYPYPNPASIAGGVNIAVQSESDATAVIRVLNARGLVVAQLTQHVSAGISPVPLDLTGFARGVYYYQVRLDFDAGGSSDLPVRSFMVRR